MSLLSSVQESSIIANLSPARMATYQIAMAATGGDPFKLYTWNAKISGAFLQSLQVCEITVRNGIAGAIERQFGTDWPWNTNFERILPDAPGLRYRPELIRARNKTVPGLTGKVIAELKFSFWCHMLTSRHDRRIWIPYLRYEFPNAPFPLTVEQCRDQLHEAMERLRALRNRIAHHEPIFAKALAQHHTHLKQLIEWRCRETADWHAQWECISATLSARP